MQRILALPLVLAVAIALTPPAPAAPPEAPPPRLALDPALADWTPRPATGIAEEWEKAIEANWIDTRFRDQMDTGPALNCTMQYRHENRNQMVYKATVVKLGEKGDAGVVFDRCTMRVAAAWTGGYLNHSDRRFGLLNTPTPKGTMVYSTPEKAVWGIGSELPVGKPPFTAPADPKSVKYRGHYLCNNLVVFKYDLGTRTIHHLVEFGHTENGEPSLFETISSGPGNALRWFGSPDGKEAWFDAKTTSGSTYRVISGVEPKGLGAGYYMLEGGKKRWGEPIVTKLVRGVEAGPFAVDTLTIPYKNRFGALFFCTGLDHLPDGRIAMCTCHGDVWLVSVDEKAATCSWQRYATGLYHPLGLKVVDGKVVVLERGQLTRLHDLNNDGEADFYECLCNQWDTGPGEHSYDTCLETDPQGNFFFFKTGDTDLPTGGCLMRVSKDGGKAEVFATGFRHPIGLGMSPSGILTGADQEGNWMPGTRIDEYKKGGFYGDMRAHHRNEAPKIYDPPLCWLPREVDNSAGGQVWVPPTTFGPLAGLPLHLSYGRCKAFVLLRQECANGVVQGGVVALDPKFLSGVCRGRFGRDGYLYVCGLNGWQTAAQADGCLQRVRYTGKALDVPVKLAVDGNAIRLTFSRELDAKSVADPSNYRAAWWNYHWSGEYGSKRWKLSDPKVEGQDEFSPRMAKLLGDGRTVELTFEKLVPVMQMQVGFNLDARDGKKAVGSVYMTINSTGK